MQKLVPVICFGLMLVGAVEKTDESAAASDVKSSSQRSEAERRAIATMVKGSTCGRFPIRPIQTTCFARQAGGCC